MEVLPYHCIRHCGGCYSLW
uniref:Uncharacterized protein n=1 Tax=Rhizophora mucronata TaxID=61149 RepID=A0A2P2QF25_RHIMU